MDDAHRSIIQSNYASLVEQTDLEMMVTALYEKGVFSDHMIERYKDQRNDVRHRKRQLYMDVMTRGPNAFRHLIDALTEAGYWDLARDLDPNSHLHLGNRRAMPSPSNDDFISIRNEKQKNKTIAAPHNKPKPILEWKPDPDNNPLPESEVKIPNFEIVKSTKFVDDDDVDRGIKVYRMRGPPPRGVLLVFSYTKFLNDTDDPRPGVEVDDASLKKLFGELGFKPLFYTNLPKDEMMSTLKGLNTVLEGMECLFTVVSSHGYERAGSYDNNFRCYDQQLMSIYEFLEYFNNQNLHVMRGRPKVFIFQICRGTTVHWKEMPMPRDSARDGCVFTDDEPAPAAREPRLDPADAHDRVYSDILIAHSTVPGVVSWRDVERGSWYIQALVQVFAAHAHDSHVEELFTLVDKRLEHSVQTSSVDRWGFNRRLYLHPGLYDKNS